MSEHYTPLQVERLLCAIYPTRYERVLGSVRGLLWGIAEGGPIGWLGDRIDDAESRHRSRRARRNIAEKTS